MVDPIKFERIVKENTQSLYNYCFCKLNYNDPLAEETVNDVFRILFEKWDELDVGDNIRLWLYRTTDNCIKRSIVKNNKYYSRINSLDECIENNALDHLEYSDEYFTDDIIDEDKYIKRIMEALPDEYKDIFRYRFIEKKTISEVAKLVGIPYTSLYLRISKIEAMVKEEIKKIFR